MRGGYPGSFSHSSPASWSARLAGRSPFLRELELSVLDVKKVKKDVLELSFWGTPGRCTWSKAYQEGGCHGCPLGDGCVSVLRGVV